jgi:hypothetical protein
MDLAVWHLLRRALMVTARSATGMICFGEETPLHRCAP